MSEMLRYSDSTDKHLSAVRRHIRLCNQVTDAHKYAQAIEPQYEALREKHAEFQAVVDNRIDAYDDMIQSDLKLDNAVRTAFEKCKQYDRENSGSSALVQIFPEEKFSDIIRTNRFKESNVIEQLAVKFESFGEKHKLYPVAAYLRKYIACMRKSVKAFRDALRNEKVVQAEEAVVKGDLRTQYEANYLDARKDMGRVAADSLFPKLSHNKLHVESPAEEEISEAA